MANDTKHAANGAADAIGPVLAAPGKDAYGWLSRVIPGGRTAHDFEWIDFVKEEQHPKVFAMT